MSAFFGSVRGFLSRHKSKFFVGGVCVAGAIFLTKYAQRKLIEWQENQAREFFVQTRKLHHFETTERTCNQTILKLALTLNESLMRTVNTEDVIVELKADGRNVETWNRFKLLIFSKAVCMVYTAVMLVLVLRLQLNLLGGYLFKSQPAFPTELQERYLSLSHYIMGPGLLHLHDKLQESLEKVVGALPLQKMLKLNDFESIFWALQNALAGSNDAPIHTFQTFLRAENSSDYNGLVQETVDLLESAEVKEQADRCVSRGFAFLIDELSQYYVESDDKSPDANINNVKISVAKVLPVLNGLVSKDTLLKLVSHLLQMGDLKTLSANVYESFSA